MLSIWEKMGTDNSRRSVYFCLNILDVRSISIKNMKWTFAKSLEFWNSQSKNQKPRNRKSTNQQTKTPRNHHPSTCRLPHLHSRPKRSVWATLVRFRLCLGSSQWTTFYFRLKPFATTFPNQQNLDCLRRDFLQQTLSIAKVSSLNPFNPLNYNLLD